MGTYVIKVPDIGEGIAEVELVEWHVGPGDAVVEEQILADVMTDKASVEIPSPVAGKIAAITGRPGDMIAVGSELVRLDVEGAGNVREADSEAAAGEKTPAAAKPAPAAETRATAAPVAKHIEPAAARHVESEAAKHVESARQPGPIIASTQAITPRAPSERPIASPAVRRRAWDIGIELRFVRGSGPGGRIMHEDLDAYVAASGQASTVAARAQLRERNDETVVPVIGLRRGIAQKMLASKRHIPHFTYVEEVDVTELEALRARLNATWEAARGRLTLLPFLIRAVVLATPAHPEVNARYEDNENGGNVTRFGAVHVGIATQTEGGLMVPVVRHAEARDLWDCAAEIARLADAARSGKIARDELSGSTITITSLGALGGIVTTPVINHPEVAIIGVNRVVERPVMRAGAIVPRRLMNLSSSFDHRVVDGMRGAEFVQALRGFLEAPATLFID
jgi:2-oxoisovalerate dehydrogenase E2 component (dihydrolipoyl transacylase)